MQVPQKPNHIVGGRLEQVRGKEGVGTAGAQMQ